MRVGVLGGTFDPVHNGHLIIAEEAQAKLGLEKVLFIPAGRPWFKDGENVSDMGWRLDMLKAGGEWQLELRDRHDGAGTGRSHLHDRHDERAEEDGWEQGVELHFIIGIDALSELGRWKEPERLASICHFATMRRPGFTELDLETIEREVPGVSGRVRVLDNVQVDISSSDIRESGGGRSVDKVPGAAGGEGLYRGAGVVPGSRTVRNAANGCLGWVGEGEELPNTRERRVK